jgi:hypothetical protein
MPIPSADEKLDMIRLAEPTEDELRAVDANAVEAGINLWAKQTEE